MNNFWDTTVPVFDYPDNFRKIYDIFYISQRKNFSNWIGKISEDFKSDIDWWSCSVSSRNTYVSKLFHNICILESLKYLNKKNKFPTKVIVNSLQLKKIINIYFNGKKIEFKKEIQWNGWIKQIYFVIIPLVFSLAIFLFSKMIKDKKSKLNKNSNYILIDIFITSNNLSIARYYNGLDKKNLKNKKNIFFVPTILYLNIFKLPILVKQIRNNKNFILKEDFINFSDIIYAFNYIFRKKKFYTKYINYKNWDLSNLIRKELSKYSDFRATLISILNYRFAKNLCCKNIKLKKVINWFENTTVDKGWNFGFRKFYPKTTVLGYQNFTLYRQFMCLHPSKAEYSYRVIPNEIIVIGKAYKKARKEFCKEIKVSVGPALRFNHLFSYKYSSERKYNILVSLNLDVIESRKILTSVINTKYGQSGKKIFIKSHPLMPLSKIITEELIPKNFVELKGDFFKIVRNSRIIISAGMSSSIIESFVCGCAILIPYINKNDYYNYRYLKIPRASYKICKSSSELDNKINHFLNEKELSRKKRISKINLLKSKLFEKTTKRNLNIFS